MADLNLIGVTSVQIDQMKINVTAALAEFQETTNAVAMLSAMLVLAKSQAIKDALSPALDQLALAAPQQRDASTALQHDIDLYAAAGVVGSVVAPPP